MLALIFLRRPPLMSSAARQSHYVLYSSNSAAPSWVNLPIGHPLPFDKVEDAALLVLWSDPRFFQKPHLSFQVDGVDRLAHKEAR